MLDATGTDTICTGCATGTATGMTTGTAVAGSTGSSGTTVGATGTTGAGNVATVGAAGAVACTLSASLGQPIAVTNPNMAVVDRPADKTFHECAGLLRVFVGVRSAASRSAADAEISHGAGSVIVAAMTVVVATVASAVVIHRIARA